MGSSVENWFGEHFSELDPLLQALHRSGGQLRGAVDLEFGSGLAGVAGRRIATKIGLPRSAGRKRLVVTISSDGGVLVWSRQFDEDHEMVSRFTPHGSFPEGFWREETGPVAMDLGVAVVEGGWYWQQRAVWFRSMRLPLWLFPSSLAYKRVVNGLYEFSVSISFPLLGKLVSYRGQLNADTSPV